MCACCIHVSSELNVVAPVLSNVKWLPVEPQPPAKEDVVEIIKLLADNNCFPYSKNDEEIFMTERKTDQLAQRCIGWPWICTVSIGSFIPIIPLLLRSSPLIGAFTGSAVTACMYCLGMVASGRSTDASSTAKDRAQDALNALEKRIYYIAEEALRQIQSSEPEEKRLAIKASLQKIKIKEIREKLGKISSRDLDLYFFRKLEEVCAQVSRDA